MEYCPTALMLADYYTTPRMGAKFQEFRNYVMRWESMRYSSKIEHCIVLKIMLLV